MAVDLKDQHHFLYGMAVLLERPPSELHIDFGD